MMDPAQSWAVTLQALHSHAPMLPFSSPMLSCHHIFLILYYKTYSVEQWHSRLFIPYILLLFLFAFPSLTTHSVNLVHLWKVNLTIQIRRQGTFHFTHLWPEVGLSCCLELKQHGRLTEVDLVPNWWTLQTCAAKPLPHQPSGSTTGMRHPQLPKVSFPSLPMAEHHHTPRCQHGIAVSNRLCPLRPLCQQSRGWQFGAQG